MNAAETASAAEALAATPLFAGLSPVEIARMVPELEEHAYEAGQAVFRQGDPADGLYLVRSGAATVTVEHGEGGSEIVATLEAPSYLGEMGLLSDEPRSANVIALTPLALWKLPRARFDALVEQHPRLPLQLAAEVTRRLAETSRKLSMSQHEVTVLARVSFELLDPDTQALLRRAALFAELDATLLSRLVGHECPWQAIEQLARDAVFLRPGEVEGSVRFTHEWLRQLLLDQLAEELGEAALAQWRRRAAEALLARGHARCEEALDLLRAAGDWPRMADALEQHGPMLARSSPDLVEAHARALPDTLLYRRPALVRLLAGCCESQGQLEGAIDAYRRAEQFDRAARTGPLGVAYQERLADVYERMGRHSQALACLRRAMELRGMSTSLAARFAGAHVPTDLPSGGEDDHAHFGRLALAGARGLSAATARVLLPRHSLSARWLVALVVLGLAGLAWTLPPPAGLSVAGLRVIVSILASLALSFLAVLPEFLIGLLMVTIWVISGTLPPSVAAAGFHSSTWFLLLSSMALGTAVARSGVLYRGALEIVRRLPPSHTVRCLTLAFLGILFSPGMPNVLGRVSLAAPLAQDIADALRYPPRSGASAGLALATYIGFGLMGSLFLTGSALALIVYGLFPPEVQASASWGTWFVAALPPHAILFGLSMAFLLVRYRPEGAAQLRAETIAIQRQVLGSLSRDEWSAILVAGALIVGFSLQSVHRLDPAWLAVAALAALFLTGALDDASFRGGVNLSFLLYLGVILGFGEIFAYVEIDGWLSRNLGGLAGVTAGNVTVFVIAIAALAAGLAVTLRPGPISVLLGLALYPTATSIGVNPLVVAITILLASTLWVYPQQNLAYLTAYYGTGERGFTHAQARPLALAWVAFVFIAILLSIPYWRWIGLIA
jgi:CRP-like cAMP-binding protein/di/tricarboxylate transporter